MEASGVPKPSKHFTSQLIPAKEWGGQSVFLLHSLTDSFLNEKIYLYMLHITVPGQSVYSGELKNLNVWTWTIRITLSTDLLLFCSHFNTISIGSWRALGQWKYCLWQSSLLLIVVVEAILVVLVSIIAVDGVSLFLFYLFINFGLFVKHKLLFSHHVCTWAPYNALRNCFGGWKTFSVLTLLITCSFIECICCISSRLHATLPPLFQKHNV